MLKGLGVLFNIFPWTFIEKQFILKNILEKKFRLM